MKTSISESSEILKDRNILIYGNQMRKTRNTELYDGGSAMITDKQAGEYFKTACHSDSDGDTLSPLMEKSDFVKGLAKNIKDILTREIQEKL